jgi:hypothetical protein
MTEGKKGLRRLITLSALWFLFGLINIALDGLNIVPENKTSIASHYYFIRIYITFTYLLSWSLWFSVIFFLVLFYQNKAKPTDLWHTQEKAFRRVACLFFALSFYLQISSSVLTPKDFQDAIWTLSPVYAACLIGTTAILTIFYVMLISMKIIRAGQPIAGAIVEVKKSVFAVSPTIIIGICFILLRDSDFRLFNALIIPGVFLFLPLFCGGPYILISLIRKTGRVKDKINEQKILPIHLICLFLFSIPIVLEIIFAILFGRG